MVTQSDAIETAKSFVRDCISNGLNFHKVLLFGSASTNTMNDYSDIDLLLISDRFNDNIFDNLNLYSKINIKYPIIETHPYSTKYFYSEEPFINQIKNNSIEII